MGGGALSALIISESTNGAQLTKKLGQFGTQLSSLFTPSSSSTQIQAGNSNFLITFFGSTIPSAATQLWNLIKQGVETLKSSITELIKFFSSLGVTFNSLNETKQYLDGLQHSLGDWSDASEFFSEIHTKIPKLVSFFSDSAKSESFKKLFQGGELEKTKKTLKILSGADQSVKSALKAERGLAVLLASEFAKNPEKVSKKIERLVKLVDKVLKPSQNNEQGGEQSSQSTAPYELTREKLKSFLVEREDRGQDGYELGLILEIGAKTQGVTLPSTTANIFALLGNLLGSSTATQTGK
ncbi:hypothetical protein [Candidatus Mycoplasma haematominutum]|uniref:Uncharacterized protein n=1 Tax=Candidatus Mycoplasma haematominutum 'Birmingham 1' TaxID=1116213 RepID=G8C3N0_9MOLU|nr:hypothetical protein [Candidatus Mycoplasma haematominutum]CCE66928.1 hypothetical protein MHM_04100 [Candidatus Mycoplasma haematominutum 'Birmingham 1']